MDLRETERINKAAGDAIRRLKVSQDYQDLTRYLKNRLDYMRERGDTLIGQEREWNQGQCQAFRFILDLPSMATPP